MSRREYNGLTGREIADLLCKRLKEALMIDGRLQEYQVYHNVELTGEFILDSYPHEPKEEKFKVAVATGGEVPAEAKPRRKRSIIKVKEKVDAPDAVREELEGDKDVR